MGREINRLKPISVSKIMKPGRYADGGGLYLEVSAAGAKKWLFFYKRSGKRREMGLGSFHAVPLVSARAKAASARETLAGGIDPITKRRGEEEEAKRSAGVPTFGALSDALLPEFEAEWRNDKHKAQWTSTLQTYAAPLRGKPVNEIDVDDVLSVLRPIGLTKSETASRLRGRIERILNAAKAKGYRTGENTAAWRGNLEHLLPARIKLTRGHHKALPYEDVPAFISTLREHQLAGSIAAYALEFTILTAVRTGEVARSKRGKMIDAGRWSEIDDAAATWTVPADRMKAGKEHVVPLSNRAVEILALVRPLARRDGFIFPGLRAGQPLSEGEMTMLLRRMKMTNATVHGFRSTFRDWAGDETSVAREVAEEALAHTVGNAVERTYRRRNSLQKRRELMEAWARYCEPTAATGNVVPLSKRLAG